MEPVPSDQWRPVPWRAAVLNLLVPGVGQLYNGRPVRGAVTYVALIAWSLIFLPLSFVTGQALLRVLLVVVGVVGGWVFCIIDAILKARQTPLSRQRVYQRWYVVIAIGLTIAFVVTPLQQNFLKAHVV